MSDLCPRLRAVCDLLQPMAQESGGRHEYDGTIQDLSTAGIRSGLARLGGPALTNAHDEAHLSAFEAGLRWMFGEHEAHRRDPLVHVESMDISGYDREYAPLEVRREARLKHLLAWPDAVEAALESLDRVPAPVAKAALGSVRGLAGALSQQDRQVAPKSVEAHDRFVAHVSRLAETGDPETAVGATALARTLGEWEGLKVDVTSLAAQALAERDRLMAMLTEAVHRLVPGGQVREVVQELVSDFPDIEGVVATAQEQTAEVLAFTAEKRLVPWHDGECLVGPAPESRSWAMAMMCWSGPYEEDTASWYHVTPPSASWPEQEQREWLQVFSATTLPAVTAHEVAPGHYSHGRALRRAPSAVRKLLISSSFAEGWAHYGEEMMIEVGFRADDPRYVIGVCLEALLRVTRLLCSVGLHTGEMSVEEATKAFERDAFLGFSAARGEAQRGTHDVGYGRYTWGKMAVLDLRERAKQAWGQEFSLERFHASMLHLGSPPLGLLDSTLGLDWDPVNRKVIS